MTGRGELALLIIIATLVTVVGMAGLPTAVAYVIASQRVPAVRVVQLLASTWLRLCVAAGVTSAAAVVLIVRGPTSSPIWLEALLVALSVMAIMTLQLILACVQGEHRFRVLNLFRPIASAAYAMGLLGLFLIVRHSNVATVLGLFVAANISACIVGGVLVAFGSNDSDLSLTITTRAMLRYGLTSLAGANAPLESLSIDQAVVGLVLSRHQLGLYAVGSAFNNLSSMLVSGIGTVALPRIAGAPDREHRDAIIKRTTLVAVLLAGAAALFAEGIVAWIVPVAFGPAFAGAVAPARVLIVAGFFLGVRRILVVFLQAMGRPGHTGVGEMLAVATLLGSAAILVPILGLVGASLALLNAALVAVLYLSWVLRAQIWERPSSAP